MSGIPSVIIRFICHLPLGFLASNGLGMYNNMKGLGSIYGVIPGGRSFLEGARIIGGVGWPLFAYNFVCFALTGFLEGLWLATIGLIDLVFTVTLIAGVAKQADFLPRTYDGCRSASDWRNGSDGRNFFHEAIKGDRWNGYRDPGKLCHGMVQNWAFCIAVIIIYGMSASINLTIGLREHYHDQNASRYGRRGRSAIASRIPADLWVLRPATVMVRHFVPGLRFLWQYAAKVSARWRSVAVPRYEYHQQLGPLASSDAGGEPRLPFKVTSLLAMELHFAELVSLAKSSKQMRGMLLGTKDPAHELEELRSFTCAGMDKAQCRICDAQDCDVVVSLPRTLASQHLETCQPCCTKCFYTTYCAHTSTTADSKRHEHKVFRPPEGSSRRSMSRLKVIRIARLLASPPSSITPSPSLPWAPLGSSRDHLFDELEALYWDGVAAELDNIVRTLRAWHHEDPDLVDVIVEDEDDDHISGFDTFVDQVSEEAREATVRERFQSQRDAHHWPGTYEAALTDVIRERKAELVSAQLKAGVRKALNVKQTAAKGVDAPPSDRIIEHRPLADRFGHAKRPAIPQLAPAKFDQNWVPKFDPLCCSRPDCKTIICGSMYKLQDKGNESSTICEDCYWRLHHGRPTSSSYVKAYKHCVLRESVSAETSRKICLCKDVKHLDSSGKPTKLFPVDRTAGHVDVGGGQCGLLRLGEAVATAKYNGLEDLAGRTGAKVIKHEEKQRRRSFKTGLDAAKYEQLDKYGNCDPTADNDVPPFVRQFAEKNPFGHVHMSLRVGPLIVENGVAHTKGGVRISLRGLPELFAPAGQRSDRVLVVDGTPDRRLWKGSLSSIQPRRLKAVMKQVVGLPFSGLLPHEAELDIVKDLLDASAPLADKSSHSEKDPAGSRVQLALEKLKVLIRSRVALYLRHIADVLFDPSVHLTWHPTQNSCQTFCNKIINRSLFKPLVRGHAEDKSQPLYLLSFVCPDRGYVKPNIKTKHDVPCGLLEDYLRNFYFGVHKDADMLDSLQEYWHDWGAFGQPLFRNQDMFPWDCTEAYGMHPTKCGDCNLAKHLWAFPFDSWSATAMHFMRSPDTYAPADVEPHLSASGPSADAKSWMRNRLYVLAASSKLYRGALAMARTPLFCRMTSWLHEEDKGLLKECQHFSRVRMGGIHRAQPFSHDFDMGSDAGYFLAPWAMLSRDEQIVEYKKLRDARAALQDMTGAVASAHLAKPPFNKEAREAGCFGGFGERRSGSAPSYSSRSNDTAMYNSQVVFIADAGFTPDAVDCQLRERVREQQLRWTGVWEFRQRRGRRWWRRRRDEFVRRRVQQLW
ncbi:L-2,4-diaminobutyrate decarboxylase [Purpureocillium lavendulum]|uniref:L-2,4-diaminobutyrate decarboxylase n=1 Tax=Purpureocillium lavendulum TaxID=1247861 RepID=A0AB34FW62_9HYPO|nr:L-2,4-diaminobutyrate decarboxylase [Purpureocillium lavendulum]